MTAPVQQIRDRQALEQFLLEEPHLAGIQQVLWEPEARDEMVLKLPMQAKQHPVMTAPALHRIRNRQAPEQPGL
ncbi:hypothetical protein NPIL_494771 [Nephila pilipes]|uniref:Uncharacterized protein n=1 Tax=Nephila pilipes TaxID=299642 RepID=A0A8X6T4H4_NEPPI|nr:hypothetical protein NPIL_494771 [Nephila pilipes]